MDVSWYSAASLAEIEKIIQAEMTRKKSNEEVCRIEQQRQETGLKRDASDEGENCFDQQVCQHSYFVLISNFYQNFCIISVLCCRKKDKTNFITSGKS